MYYYGNASLPQEKISYEIRLAFLLLFIGSLLTLLPSPQQCFTLDARTSEVGRMRTCRERARWQRECKAARGGKGKNQYSLWRAELDTSDPEIFALMPSPVLRRRCWHDGAEAYCRGTIWQSSVQLEFQCASSSLALCTFCFRSHKNFLLNTFTALGLSGCLWVLTSSRRARFVYLVNYTRHVPAELRTFIFISSSISLANGFDKFSLLHGTLWFSLYTLRIIFSATTAPNDFLGSL